MRKNFIVIFLLGISCTVMSQAVGVGTNTPHSSSLLEISSNNKGLLLPRLNDTNSVSNPAKGLTIYSTANNKTWFYNGSRWQQLVSNAGGMDSIWYATRDSIVYTQKKYVGINSDYSLFPPQANLQVSGNILVQEPQIHSKALPTQSQTYTMNNSNSNQFIPISDSVFRLYDPGGNGNYGTNTRGNVVASGADKQDQIGWKIKFNAADFGLAAGDTLWISRENYPYCISDYEAFFTSTSSVPEELIYSEIYLNFVFRSDNAEVARGFDISAIRLFSKDRLNAQRPNTVSSSGSALYLAKGSFAAGFGSNAKGFQSLALGANSTATGNFSAAIGTGNFSRNANSFSIGSFNQVNAERSVAIGASNQVKAYSAYAFGSENAALGNNSLALGYRVVSKASGSVAIGMANDTSDKVSDFAAARDRIFQIGNGNVNFRNNALTVLRNGNIGIGMTEPNAPLQLANTVANRKIVLFENANDNLEYFGFGINDYALRYNVTSGSSHIFYCTSNALFTINSVGNALLRGTLAQNSDARLKTNIIPLAGSLTKITQLTGYNYNWKDNSRSDKSQIGLLAQEVQLLFPELIEKDESGNLSVNYIALTPVLIEAIKELNERIAKLEKKAGR